MRQLIVDDTIGSVGDPLSIKFGESFIDEAALYAELERMAQ